MSENIFKYNQKIMIKTFIPDIYMDDKTNKKTKNIPDSSSARNGIYRFYGIFIGSDQKIGYIKYHILFDESTIEIDRIEVLDSYQRYGYGTMLMKYSLVDLITDFPHIESVIVCSSALAIPFYIKNDFKPYFGDNNLIKTLQKS